MSNRVRPTRTTHRSSRPERGLPPWLPIVIVVGVVGFGILAGIMVGRSSQNSEPTGVYVSDVVVTGETLPPTVAPGTPDPAVGMTAPELEGRTFDGSPLAFTNDGSPRVVAFVAHWCPHCQRDVADVTGYLADHPVPGGIEVQTVSTLVDENAANFPPDRWLESEGWPWPVMNDDENNTAARAFGLTGTPLWVFVDADGHVVERVSGEIGAAALWQKMEALAAGS